MRTYSIPEVHATIPGPWADEPDKAQWIDEATDLDCLAVRNYGGAWCGYVGVPPGHPYHGADPFEIDTDVHGGLNYGALCDETDEGAHAVCHVPEPGRPADVYWLGFHCSYAFDLSPMLAQHVYLKSNIPAGPRILEHQTYRTFDYVQAECARLAKQLAEAQTS